MDAGAAKLERTVLKMGVPGNSQLGGEEPRGAAAVAEEVAKLQADAASLLKVPLY